eukprot:424420_1
MTSGQTCCLCPQISNSLKQTKTIESNIHIALQLEIINSNNTETKTNDDHPHNEDAILSVSSADKSIFSFHHFTIIRSFSCAIFSFTLIQFLFLPISLIWQTITFTLGITCHLSADRNFEDISTILYYDYLHLFIGRIPSKKNNQKFSIEWFIAQTKQQKIARIVLTLIVLIATIYEIAFGLKTYLNLNENRETQLSVLEMVGPAQIQIMIGITYSFVIAVSRPIVPEFPSPPQCLTKNRIQLITIIDNEHQCKPISVRQFYINFFANDDTFGVNINKYAIMMSLILSFIFAITPTVIRTFGNDPHGLHGQEWLIMIVAFVLNLCESFIFMLCVGNRLMNGISTTFREMLILTHILNPESYVFINDTCMDKICRCGKRQRIQLPYLELGVKSNFILWLEMRSAVYWKCKIMIASSESIISVVIMLGLQIGMYLIYRVLTESHISNMLESPSFVGLMILFIVIWSSLIMMLVNALAIQKLQKYQKVFILAQKGKVEYEMMNKIMDGNSDGDMKLNTVSEQYKTLLEQINIQNISPKVYGVTLDTALLRSIFALTISGLYAIGQYLFSKQN